MTGYLALALLYPPNLRADDIRPPRPLPEFTARAADAWINSAPLTAANLRGRVTLIDVWTFDCWNCYRSFPWLTGVEGRYGSKGLRVVGIHSPEFAHEAQREAVVRKAAEFGLRGPIMMDNDHAYWKALGNQFWPAFYLVDKQGRLRSRYVGEMHAGDPRARLVERDIERLLAE